MTAEVRLALRFTGQCLLSALVFVAVLHALALADYFVKQGPVAAG